METFQGWPSGLGSELIIRLRQVQLLHPGLFMERASPIELSLTASLNCIGLRKLG